MVYTATNTGNIVFHRHSRENGNPESQGMEEGSLDPRWSLPSNALIEGGDDRNYTSQDGCGLVSIQSGV